MDHTIELMRDIVLREKPDIVDCHIAHNAKMDAALGSLPVPHMVTFHGPTKDRQDLQDIIDLHPSLPIVTVSKLQQQYLRANYVGVVPNGLPETSVAYNPGPRTGDLVMLARLSPKKDFPRGIEIAKRAGKKLAIGGALLNDQMDMDYYNQVLVPLFDRETETVAVRSDVTERNKTEFFAGKTALLALTKREKDRFWPQYVEADGLHISEALAAGVPVICDDGVDASKVPTGVGFVCNTVEEAVEALDEIDSIDPEACRRHFLENYTVGKTVEQRLAVMTTVILAFQFPGLFGR